MHELHLLVRKQIVIMTLISVIRRILLNNCVPKFMNNRNIVVSMKVNSLKNIREVLTMKKDLLLLPVI